MTSLVAVSRIADYLAPAPLVDFGSQEIEAFVDAHLRDCDDVEAARRAFHFVRDEIAHSWDVQGRRVTRSATDALRHREGICYSKSHAAFSLTDERLAFPVRPMFRECDYPALYAAPHPAIVEALSARDDALEMYRSHLPSELASTFGD